jgi:hypothetical protein
VKNLEDASDQAENENTRHHKLIHFYPYEDNSNIGLSDKDPELMDTLNLPDFIEKTKSKSPNLPSNLRGSSMNYWLPAVKIPQVDIDRSEYQDFSEWRPPSPSRTSNNPNTPSQFKNLDTFKLHSLSAIKTSASEKSVSNKDSVVSNYFHTSSGKIL